VPLLGGLGDLFDGRLKEHVCGTDAMILDACGG
jgi:hypothetical protein